jgi:hypothetical protein
MRDFQKQPVYDWTHAFFRNISTTEMSEDECTSLIRDIARCYGFAMPILIFKNEYQAKASFYSPSANSITLYRHARHRYFLLHEAAHWVHHMTGRKGSAHGPEYFSIYAYLLNQYMGFPLHEIFQKAMRYGIQFHPTYPKFIEKPGKEFVGRYF